MRDERAIMSMSIGTVLLPLFVQIALTFVLGFWMAAQRAPAVRRREIDARKIALREPNWPPHMLQVGNAYQNQLETPLLFYVLTILALVTRQADLFFVVLAWIFVALRVLHAYVHVTDNHLGRRGASFGAAVVVLLLMWIYFAVRILIGPA
jgi:hypothetical protein